MHIRAYTRGTISSNFGIRPNWISRIQWNEHGSGRNSQVRAYTYIDNKVYVYCEPGLSTITAKTNGDPAVFFSPTRRDRSLSRPLRGFTLFSAMISVQPQCNSELFDVFHRITHLLHFLVIIRSNHFCCWNIGQVIPERTNIREEKGTSERC